MPTNVESGVNHVVHATDEQRPDSTITYPSIVPNSLLDVKALCLLNDGEDCACCCERRNESGVLVRAIRLLAGIVRIV